MKKLVLAAVATLSLVSFAGEAPAAKKVDAKPVATAPAKTIAAAPTTKGEKTEVKAEEKKETLAATPEAAKPAEAAKPVEGKKVVTKKK